MSYYGGWCAGDDYRAKGEIVVTSNAATSVSFKAVTYVESQYGYDGYGSTSADANAYGGTVRTVTGQSFSDWSTKKLVESAVRTVAKTHSSQTIQCSGYVSSYAGQSSWFGNVTVAALASYTVTYNANGGTGTTSAQTKWYGETLALRSNGFSRTGYTFVKWNTKADGSGTSYAAGGTVAANVNQALTLYAIWKANTYKVTPNANGGTLHTNCKALTKTYGTALALWLSSLNPTRTGYTFQNWNTKSNGSGTAYAAGAQYKTEAAATLYAIWKANTYAVTFNANGGSGAPAAQTQTHGVALTLSSTRPTRVGYTFLGWNTAADGTGTAYAAGGTYTANAAVTLYAQWRADAPTLVVPEAYRSDALGAADDEGAYATVTTRWTQADETLGGSVTITATVRSRGSDPSPDDPTTSVTQTGTTGSASVTVGAGTLTQDDAYTITVTATNALGTTTVVADVGTAWYPIDVKAGGHGIAIGGVAHDDGFVVNMDETVNGTMRLGVSNPVEASNDNGILRIVNSGGYELSFGSNGRLTNGEGFNAKSGNITSNTAPSSDTTGSGSFRLFDSVGATPIGFLAAYFAASGNQYVRLHTQRVINGSLKQNQLNLGVSSSGDALVTISGTGAAAAWRDAIGAASSVLGTLLTDDVSTAVSIASGTWTTIGSVTLDPGLWLIDFTGVFTSNATGRRAMAVSNTANSAGNASEQRQGFVSANATNGTSTGLSGSRIFLNQTSSSYVLRLNVYQNSGSALNVTGCIRAMRIK